MRISVKNILLSIGVIVLTYMAFDTVLNVLKVNYTLNLIKETSAVPLKDYDIYGDLNTVIKKYVRCLKNQEYSKLKDMSLYYAKMSNEEYKALSDKLVISDLFELSFNDISVLDSEIYLCEFNIKNTNSFSQEVKMVVKLNREKGFFRVLNIETSEV
ncbi:MAG: hypothetical protein IJ809_03650 [Clostridia bacterium]|nr:hypothetical protein [Clostridia bacterium]